MLKKDAVGTATRGGLQEPHSRPRHPVIPTAVDQVDEELFPRYLYQPDLPELDLLIRTSGEIRLSNFMLWQLSYAEIVVTKVLWPDFRRRHLHAAIADYQARSRRFGGR